MPVVFISYRRSDSQDVTGRIYDRLVAKFTQKQVFKDVDNIPLGVSFPMHIKQMLTKANVALVIIGPNWVNATDENGKRRLDDPNDYVRLEVEVALRANMPVIPILVSSTIMPKCEDLPPSMQKLLSRNGIRVRPDPDFNNDMGRLFSGIDHLERMLAVRSPKQAKPRVVDPPSDAFDKTVFVQPDTDSAVPNAVAANDLIKAIPSERIQFTPESLIDVELVDEVEDKDSVVSLVKLALLAFCVALAGFGSVACVFVGWRYFNP